ncbi:site-specific integrase [Vibrio sp. Y2-5]|uniref:site-specific integrase n=1 Tax=Vibrio sp. Y2-5 TaxID=2743977 RepID=UPI00166009C8|nr:site-specific integrase [Vibrio sp. Y2-5]MBD0788082.1 site-specific integrase [Vibrio sp. Y2-5]
MDSENIDFKWVFNPPKKKVKQPDTITLNEFDSLIDRIDNPSVDPLIAARNQAILWATLGSTFRAIECSKWLVKEALYESGGLMYLTRIRASATKGSQSIIAPVFIDNERYYIERWLDLRVKHRVGMNYGKRQDLYRGLDPESPVFMSNHHREWKPFALQRKTVKGKEYEVCTSMQNTIKSLYQNYGHAGCSAHSGRHTMARLAQKILSKKCTDSELKVIIQNLLHHRDIRSQDEYVDIDWNQLREKASKMFK